jgi:aryl-alcohol dehydrogenase-like predicted oxidoreductase
MEYVNLGRSGLSVSRLCLGTMNFGPLTSLKRLDDLFPGYRPAPEHYAW